MNDDVEQVCCPRCGKVIEVVLCWEEADYSVGLFGGWTGGIAVEDTACFNHMTYPQIEATVDSAIIQREMRDEAAAREDIARDLDEMQRQREAERAYAPDVKVDWCGESEPY